MVWYLFFPCRWFVNPVFCGTANYMHTREHVWNDFLYWWKYKGSKRSVVIRVVLDICTLMFRPPVQWGVKAPGHLYVYVCLRHTKLLLVADVIVGVGVWRWLYSYMYMKGECHNRCWPDMLCKVLQFLGRSTYSWLIHITVCQHSPTCRLCRQSVLYVCDLYKTCTNLLSISCIYTVGISLPLIVQSNGLGLHVH